MLIRTIKEYDHEKIEAAATCDFCQRTLFAPPIIILTRPSRVLRYHLKCACQLAYTLLFAITGKPDEVA